MIALMLPIISPIATALAGIPCEIVVAKKLSGLTGDLRLAASMNARRTATTCEIFNGRLRDELLAREQSDTLLEAKVLIERWRRHYNTVRPHGSLGYRPPAPEAIQPLHFVPATPPLREVAGLTVIKSLT